MTLFDQALTRLKNAVNIKNDSDIALLLKMPQSTFASKKARGSFPEEELKDLIQREPWREIDFEFIMTGELSTFEQINRRFKSETGLKNDLDVIFALGIRDRDFIQGRLNNLFPIHALYTYNNNPSHKKINIDYVVSGKTVTVEEYGVHLIEMLEKLAQLSTDEQLSVIKIVEQLYTSHKTCEAYKSELKNLQRQ